MKRVFEFSIVVVIILSIMISIITPTVLAVENDNKNVNETVTTIGENEENNTIVNNNSKDNLENLESSENLNNSEELKELDNIDENNNKENNNTKTTEETEKSEESKLLENSNITEDNKSVEDNLITTKAAAKPTVEYKSHVQNIGWQNYVNEGNTSGTSGQSLRLEGILIKINNAGISGSIEYSTHVQNIGWQNFVSNNQLAGTTGQSLRLEAIKIRLTGELAKQYDVYYRTHVQQFGWLDWAKNGEESGSEGYSYRMEAVEIKLVAKNGTSPSKGGDSFKIVPPNIFYSTHIQNIGWQEKVSNGNSSGTSGQSLRLEAISIYTSWVESNGIQYSTHIQNIGWQDYKSNGSISGTEGQSLRLEAIKIKLTNDLAKKYDVYYRAHVQQIGWLDWAKNDQPSGTQGYGYRLEAIQIKLVKKNSAAPGATTNTFFDRTDEPNVVLNVETAAMVQNPANTLNVTGWYLKANNNAKLRFLIDDNVISVNESKIERADVLKSYPNYNKTVNAKPGFVASINTSSIPDGSHTLKVQVLSTRSNAVLKEETKIFLKYSNKYIGIDVSEHNGTIDWAKAKTQIDFAIVRCGYGMDLDDYGGHSQDDVEFIRNMNACRAYNIPVSIYLYSYADSTARASSEADHVIRLAQPYKDIIGTVWYDVEDKSVFNQIRNGKLSKDGLGAIVDNFANKVKNAGYKVGIYSGAYALTTYFNDNTKNKYEIWMAHYTGANRNNYMSNMSDYENIKYNIWQFADDERINGISGNVDMNVSFGKHW